MAEEEAGSHEGGGGEGSKPAKAKAAGGSLLTQLLLPLLNTIAVAGTAGFFYYSKIVYKRPAITEEAERKKLEEEHEKPLTPSTPAFINFDPITVNIKGIPDPILPADGTSHQIHGKLHYATVGFAVEIRDKEQQEIVQAIKPVLLDRLIHTLGKKQYHELANVQGRYILMSELLDFANRQAMAKLQTPTKEPLITNLFFTQFTVQ